MIKSESIEIKNKRGQFIWPLDSTQTETDSDNNQLSQTNYTYDDNGNMTAKARVVGENTTTTAFSYDALDRTESIGNNTFAYDCDGNRIVKSTDNTTTETVWNNGEISADLIGDSVKVFTEDNSVYCENGTFTFNAIDSKGDVVAATSSYYGDYTYDAWDNDLYNTNTTNPIGYRGYYFDSETGLYYLKARYYDSTTGQFTQEDTVQDDNLQYNLYGYCSGNPVLYTDPTGHLIYYNITKRLNNAMKNNATKFYNYSKKVLKNSKNNYISLTKGIRKIYSYFYTHSKTGGKWDLKNKWQLNKNWLYVYNKDYYRYDDIGNIHFGYVGYLLFSLKELQLGAGLYQLKSGTSKIEYIFSYFDDPRDSDMIKKGFNIAKKKKVSRISKLIANKKKKCKKKIQKKIKKYIKKIIKHLPF